MEHVCRGGTTISKSIDRFEEKKNQDIQDRLFVNARSCRYLEVNLGLSNTNLNERADVSLDFQRTESTVTCDAQEEMKGDIFVCAVEDRRRSTATIPGILYGLQRKTVGGKDFHGKVRDLPICSPWTFRENHSPNIIYTVNRRNQPTAMDLYFLNWVHAPDTKPSQKRTQNQPTRYYDQADASYELGPRGQLGWGSGLALAIWVGLGRVGQQVKKNNLRSKDDVWTVVLSESPWTANRRSRKSGGFVMNAGVNA